VVDHVPSSQVGISVRNVVAQKQALGQYNNVLQSFKNTNFFIDSHVLTNAITGTN
jgi:hypothetical protein